MIHTYKGETIRFEIKYKNRTSIGITIDSYGNVEVQAPKGISEEKILGVIETNWHQILKKINEMQDRLSGPKQRDYEHGESFLFLGKSYPIKVIPNSTISQDHVRFEGDTLHIYIKEIEEEKIKQALKRFYYQECKALVEKRISKYQNNFKVKPKSIRITDSKATWGTCDSNHQLTFNWRLAMAPLKVIDYVVIHEMCHMVHLNHDRSFWRLVGKIMPDYKEQENWLALSSWKMTV